MYLKTYFMQISMTYFKTKIIVFIKNPVENSGPGSFRNLSIAICVLTDIIPVNSEQEISTLRFFQIRLDVTSDRPHISGGKPWNERVVYGTAAKRSRFMVIHLKYVVK